MARALQMIPEQKQIIINMKNHGESDRTVAKYVGCNQSTVSRVYKRWKEEHTVPVQQRSGRPRKTDERMDQVIWRLNKKDRFETATFIRSFLLKHYGLSLSSRTIRRRLNEEKLFGRSAWKKPFINLRNRCLQVEWAKKYEHFTVENWMNVLFSASKFMRVHSSNRVYVRHMTGEQHSIKCTRPIMGSDTLMMWGCFSWHGMRPMIEL